ncbi:hypothetical protein TOL_0212 [Thalassolituus oleivorans MIL-1]|uniref:Uncharacterized protein n=2 Tax=root TaxID=1 RepID=M5DLJ4_9GAMM|nr:hypothetical protein TOL_0212 [Thalassolituus oleivorans MIL-1]
MFEWETLFPVTGPFPVTWQTLDIDLRPDFYCIEQFGKFVTNRKHSSSFCDDFRRPG